MKQAETITGLEWTALSGSHKHIHQSIHPIYVSMVEKMDGQADGII